jgi:hypothetical protein
MMRKALALLPVLIRLGPVNVAAVALYRLALRCGVYERLLPKGASYAGPFFPPEDGVQKRVPGVCAGCSVVEVAEELLRGIVPYFSYRSHNIGSPPDWFSDPIHRQRCGKTREHWSRISDFDSGVADIKILWEPSRFDWSLVFARAYRLTGDRRFLKGLNAWVGDWIQNNPVNTGPNWKCGQETGIRMLQLLLTAFVLGRHQTPSEPLVRFVFEHCRRIEPTMRYAISQNNNHGTSEAAALFIGGAWLEKFCADEGMRRKALRWTRKGRRCLEKLVKKLVARDGSFSQYSVNYHRVLVDTLNMVEFWRRELGLSHLSPRFYVRARAAVHWLFHMVDASSGDAPNLGANDGARLFVLSETGYRDFRPSVQLGAALFLDGRAYPAGAWDEPLYWLQLTDRDFPALNLVQKTTEFPRGGYVAIRGGEDQWGVLRYPNFRFRPGHADAFHVDLWCGGQNVLRDSGSFSYSADEPWRSYFRSTKAHNTVEFDGRDQMPSLSRFLRGAWLKTKGNTGLIVKDEKTSWYGEYRDHKGCRHGRMIVKDGARWIIIDELEGFDRCAVLRWRLLNADWKTEYGRCVSSIGEIEVNGDVPIKRFEIVADWESRHYFHKCTLPVLEAEVEAPRATLISRIRLNGYER